MPRKIDHLLVQALPSLRTLAMRLTGDLHSAEDLVQDTAVRALARSDLFVTGTNFQGWLTAIMRHQHIDQLRRNRRSLPLDNAVLRSLPAVPPSQEAQLDLEDLSSAMILLQEDQRRALTLIVEDGRSYEEAAEICGCPSGTIRSRLSRARQKLRETFNGEKQYPLH